MFIVLEVFGPCSPADGLLRQRRELFKDKRSRMLWNCSRHSCEGVNGQIADVNAVAWTCKSRLSLLRLHGFCWTASVERDTTCMIYTRLTTPQRLVLWRSVTVHEVTKRGEGKCVHVVRVKHRHGRRYRLGKTGDPPGAGKFSGRSKGSILTAALHKTDNKVHYYNQIIFYVRSHMRRGCVRRRRQA